MLRIVLVILAVVLALAGVAAYVWVYPYVAPPPEATEVIDARWAAVEGWALETRGYEGDAAGLRRALERLDESRLRDFKPGDAPLTDDDLDPAAREALRELVGWSEGGGLGPAPCIGNFQAAPLPAFKLFTLALLALHSADDPDAPQAAAALRLGDALRSRGDLLLTMVGFGVADRARTLAEERSWPLGQGFVDDRPRREQAFPALAREAFCAERTLEALLRAGQGPGDEVIGLGGMERELAMLRWYEGRRIAALEPLRGDIQALARALEAPPEAPASLLVQTMRAGPSVFGDLDELFVAYDRYLATAE